MQSCAAVSPRGSCRTPQLETNEHTVRGGNAEHNSAKLVDVILVLSATDVRGGRRRRKSELHITQTTRPRTARMGQLGMVGQTLRLRGQNAWRCSSASSSFSYLDSSGIVWGRRGSCNLLEHGRFSSTAIVTVKRRSRRDRPLLTHPALFCMASFSFSKLSSTTTASSILSACPGGRLKVMLVG